jgi:iron(III) transport system ATP-binding protein
MEDLRKSYGPRVIYDGFSLTIRRGERWAVMGRNGAGKSTLLKMIAGLVQPDVGMILFGGRRVLGPAETLVPGHREIAYLSQHFELRNNYRVGRYCRIPVS